MSKKSAKVEHPTSLLVHAMQTLRIATPVMVARAGILLMVSVDTAMIGHFSSDDLAFYGLGLAPQVAMIITGIGLMIASQVLVAQAFGAGKFHVCGKVWRIALVIGAALGLILMALCQAGQWFFLITGQPEHLAIGGGLVVAIFGFGIPAVFFYAATSFFLEGSNRPFPGMVVMLAANFLNAGLNWVLIFGHWGVPELGAAGAATATTVVRWLMFISLALWLLWTTDRVRFGLTGKADNNKVIAKTLLRIGQPLAIAHFIEATAFSSLTLFAGLLGTVPLAGFQISINLVAVVFMMALGFATAASIRVGHAVGRNDYVNARRAGWVAFSLATAIMVIFSLIFRFFSEELAAIYTDDPVVAQIAMQTISIAAIVLVADGLQGVLIGALRGMADVVKPMLGYLVILWGLTVPLAYIWGVERGGGAPALMTAVLIGLVLLTLFFSVRFVIVSQLKTVSSQKPILILTM